MEVAISDQVVTFAVNGVKVFEENMLEKEKTLKENKHLKPGERRGKARNRNGAVVVLLVLAQRS